MTTTAEALDLDLSVSALEVHAFALSPGVSVRGLRVAAPGYEPVIDQTSFAVRMAWWHLLTGLTVIDEIRVDQIRLNALRFENERANWAPVWQAWNEFRHRSGDSDHAIAIRELRMESGEIEYIHEALDQQGFFDWHGEWTRLDTYLDASIDVQGEINFLPIRIVGRGTMDFSEAQGGSPGTLTLQADIADMLLQLRGTSGPFGSIPGTQLTLDVEGQELSPVLKKLNIASTDIAELDFATSIEFLDKQVVQAGFELALDDSFATGRLRAQAMPGSRRTIRIGGDVELERLRLDSLVGESLEGDQWSVASSEEVQHANRDTRVFSFEPLLAAEYMERVEFDVNVGIASLQKAGFTAKNTKLALMTTDGEHRLSLDSEVAGQGSILGLVKVRSSDSRLQGDAELQMRSVDVEQVMALAELPEGAVSGTISGDMQARVRGQSLAELARSLDGELFLRIDDGEMDALLVEMAGLDLMESVRLVVGRDLQQTDIRCGILSVKAQAGRIEIENMIVDTDDSVLIGSGEVDLHSEELDLSFSAHPRDASYFAATTPVHLVGTLQAPRARPGKKLYSRVVLAAAMATLVSPAAVLLPFIELGRSQRNTHCDELVGK